ncbi:hypothetical protein CYMTET_5158 [Cymbomonas tetramitiformis]|uniref:Uncharacterized protein n=1 Tax=Cymbomonas tetramitiformis TaxID=36881 RepID=A0AAE0LJC7_9CHLO|nr:hypothetical protein CYMTET_5158 [Cymbomonas tetramitiformis]
MGRECYAAHVRTGTAGRPKQPFSSAAARFGDPPGQDSTEGDLMDILLGLRKEMRVLSDKINGKGFTPRAEKPPVVESDFYATAFQDAIDTNDCDRFDALCFLAGGNLEIIEDFSAASFCVNDTVEKAAIDESPPGAAAAMPPPAAANSCSTCCRASEENLSTPE